MNDHQALIKPEERQRLSISMTERGIRFNAFEDLYRFAQAAADTDFVPKDMRNKPMTVLVAMEFCLEIGLPILAGIRNIAVINGRPSLWGDVMVGMVKGSGVMEYEHSAYEGTPFEPDYCAIYVSKRQGYPEPFVTYFYVRDAIRAKLWGKSGAWTEYPDRMLLARCRGFHLRDHYADVLMGLTTREEAEDIEDQPVLVSSQGEYRQALNPVPPEEAKPTIEQIRELQAQAQASGIAKDNLQGELRRFFGVKGVGRMSQAQWAEALTVADVQRGHAHYTARLKAVMEADVSDHSPTSDASKPSASPESPQEAIVDPDASQDDADTYQATSTEWGVLLAQAKRAGMSEAQWNLLRQIGHYGDAQAAVERRVAGPVPDEDDGPKGE